ncbi:hypothetical protein AB0K21_21890 [Streptosporangium sp. NPDC049248]|uniref:hypothetical protein n=1 Tax=Streptosporangium sp. NPDC049248 TaxID=3155651 RepID=UPI00341723E7
MESSTTPTNDLITDAATLYVLLLTALQIPAAVFATAGANRRPIVVVTVPNCAVEQAVIYWDEKITAQLIAAHDAMNRLSTVSLNRATSDYQANGRYDVVTRAEIKSLRLVIAQAENVIRHELAKTEAQIRAGLISEVLEFFRS